MMWPTQNDDPMFYVRYSIEHAGTEGHNQHGVPLHATYGVRHDAHYHSYIRHLFNFRST